MKFINLTPHTIVVKTGEDDFLCIPASGEVARVSTKETEVRVIDGVQVVRRITGEAEGIPTPQNDTYYIVSAMVLSATDRADVIAPDTGNTAVRDDKGQIQAVTRWVTNERSDLC